MRKSKRTLKENLEHSIQKLIYAVSAVSQFSALAIAFLDFSLETLSGGVKSENWLYGRQFPVLDSTAGDCSCKLFQRLMSNFLGIFICQFLVPCKSSFFPYQGENTLS